MKAQPAQKRRVYIGSAGGWADAQIYNRDALQPGFSGTGPAVIEEYGSTTVVWPGDNVSKLANCMRSGFTVRQNQS